jgi:hypothetical protein
MKRALLTASLVLAMTFGLVNLDFSSLTSDTGSVVDVLDIGASDAEARPRGRSGRSFSRPKASRPRHSRPAPKPAKPRPEAAKPKPKKGDAATKAAKRQQSQRKAVGSTARPAIKSSSGKPIKVAGTPAAKSVRSMDSTKYASRNARRESRYRGIPRGERTVIINRYGGSFYGDPYSGLFMYSLLSMSLHNQAMFHHHHWNSYSDQRRHELQAENAQLKAEMASLQNTPRNPNYAPEGTDPDLMYSDEFVDAAYNPAPVKESSGGLAWLLAGIVVAGLVASYFVFVRRTNNAPSAFGS